MFLTLSPRRRLGQEGGTEELQHFATGVPFPPLPLTVAKLRSYLWAIASAGGGTENQEAFAAYAAIEHEGEDIQRVCAQFGPQYPIIFRACAAQQFYIAPVGGALVPQVITVPAAPPPAPTPAPPPAPAPAPVTIVLPPPPAAPPAPAPVLQVQPPPPALPYGYTVAPSSAGFPQIAAVPTAEPPADQQRGETPVLVSAAALTGGTGWGWLLLLALAGGLGYYYWRAGTPTRRRGPRPLALAPRRHRTRQRGRRP